MLRVFMLGIFAACLLGSCTKNQPPKSMAMQATTNNQTVYDFTMDRIDGKRESLSKYKGKVLLIVNVASKCGFTPQYEDIQQFYAKYQSQGVEVLGFPANNFLGQEPGTNEEIQQFCTSNFHVTFPMFAKISVKGKDIHPLYQYLTTTLDTDISWNFNKILIDKHGHPIQHFGSRTNVTDEELLAAVTKALK